MVNLQDNTIVLLGRVERIKHFEVWWVTPEGLSETLELAKEVMTRLNVDMLMLRPVCVAIGVDNTYEMLLR